MEYNLLETEKRIKTMDDDEILDCADSCVDYYASLEEDSSDDDDSSNEEDE